MLGLQTSDDGVFVASFLRTRQFRFVLYFSTTNRNTTPVVNLLIVPINEYASNYANNDGGGGGGVGYAVCEHAMARI